MNLHSVIKEIICRCVRSCLIKNLKQREEIINDCIWKKKIKILSVQLLIGKEIQVTYDEQK